MSAFFTIDSSLLTDYEHVELLGEGSFGRVHLCRNRHNGKRRAIKLVMPAGGEQSNEFAQSVKETELQQKLASSEFVASVFSWGTIDGQYLWVLLEWCEGGMLTSLISSKKKGGITAMNQEKIMSYCNHLAQGLSHIHELLVMHRDIKPDNILVSLNRSSGERILKYSDFGLALQLDGESLNTHGRCGTEEYLAPEVDARQPYTLTADCWSLGIVLFQLFTGTAQSALGGHRFTAACKVEPRSEEVSRTLEKLDERKAVLLNLLLQSDPAKRSSANGLVAFLIPRRPSVRRRSVSM